MTFHGNTCKYLGWNKVPCLNAGKNILIIGGVATGKTVMIKSLLETLQENNMIDMCLYVSSIPLEGVDGDLIKNTNVIKYTKATIDKIMDKYQNHKKVLIFDDVDKYLLSIFGDYL